MVQARRQTRRRQPKRGGQVPEAAPAPAPVPVPVPTYDASSNPAPTPAPTSAPEATTYDASSNVVAEVSSIYVYRSPQITSQINADAAYQEVGIVHVTESAAINAARGLVTGAANFFGSKGFDNTVFDTARNDALAKLAGQLTPNQKVCNLRMETSSDGDATLVFVHLYGTLLEKEE